ncbi:MAG: phosphoglycerate dehydrogenase [Deltaproteobacteria bacterium]|nr:phosphoglycerate dehydrogenase [Deltaproteobacteria bacterium]
MVEQDKKTSFPKSKIEIVLLEGIHALAVETFRKETFSVDLHPKKALGEELARMLETAHVVGIRSGTKMTREALASPRRLLAVGCFCIGTDQVDLEEASKLGIPVFNAPYASTRSVAEMVIAEAVMLLRRTFQKSSSVHAGDWPKTAEKSFELRGKTLGIIGYGHIGSQVSVLAESMGMQVIYHDTADVMPLGNAKKADGLHGLLENCDVATLHVPADETTLDMIDAEALTHMRPDSYLINASRGSVVVIDALAQALEEGRVGGAAVDVFPKEPASPKHPFTSPLQGMSNVILTPHVGGSTLEAQASIARDVAHKLVRYVNNGSTSSAVNFPEVDLPVQGAPNRILHIHHNVPGVLTSVNGILSKAGINIQGQYLRTRNRIGYLVMDVDPKAPAEVIEALSGLEQTIRIRQLY